MTRLFQSVVLLLSVLAIGNGQNTLSDQIRSAQASGDYGRAAHLYQQFIAAGNDTPEMRSNLGMMLHLAGKNQEALQEFRNALQRKPSLASASLFAGLTEFDLGQYRAALPYLQRAKELDSGRPEPLLALAKTYLALRNYGPAHEAYKAATALTPNSAEAWFGTGVTARAMADALLNESVRKGEAESPAVSGKVQQLLSEALNALSRAVDLEPDSARTRLVMAEALSDKGDFAEAIPEYRKAAALDPKLEGTELGLATAFWKQHQFAEATPLLQRILEKQPGDPEANGMMADIAEHDGNMTEAKRYASVALKGNPALIETRIVLARVYLKEQKPLLAIAELKPVSAADPDGSYHYLLYRAYQQTGDAGAAAAALLEYKRKHGAATPQ